MIALALQLTMTVPDGRETAFVYVADKSYRTVTLAGTFNGWNKEATPMKLAADGRTWSTTVRLPYGKHQYKFVRDGDDWITDPKAKVEDDGNGHQNSVLLVLPADYDRPARRGDGVVSTSMVRHDATPRFINYDRGRMRLALQARPNDLNAVAVEIGGKRYPMTVVGGDEVAALYAVDVPWDRKSDLLYTFRVDEDRVRPYFSKNGLSSQPSPFRISAKTYVPFVTPAWVERSVMYQIFPDRFENGDKRNDPKGVQPWNAEPTYFNRFGGDVAGVVKRLGYLKGLGIGNVYFNPVFASPSNHRYDATDYKRVDPEFGTNDEFVALVRQMKAAGIRTVLDFAFNHTATDNPFFLDLIEKGAESPYREWYYPKSFPIVVKENPPYEAWYGFPSMPKLNVMNPPTKEYLLSIVDYWLHDRGVDGARLDVANEVDMRFWRAMRTHLKAAKPEAYILGEEWADASAWLGGDQWDASMNYAFREAALGFFATKKSSPSDLGRSLMTNAARYAPQVNRAMMNLLGSHDTPRFLTLCKGDAEMARLAAALQFTWIGMPSIYYGDELGMEGGADPQNRRGMRWDLATDANPFLARYRKLIAIRRSSAALQSGDPRVLLTDDAAGTFGFARIVPALGKAPAEVALVAINRSDVPREVSLPIPSEASASGWVDVLVGGRPRVVGSRVLILLPPKEAAILLPRGPRPTVSSSLTRVAALSQSRKS